MVDMDDLPDEGGPQPATQKGRATGQGNSGQNVPKTAPTDDLPDEGGQGVDDYPDKNLIKDDPTPEQTAGTDYYVTLEGVEKELEGIAESLEIGAWEGQDGALRVQIKCLQAIRHTLNGAINR